MQLKHCGGKKHSPLMGAGEHPHPHPSSLMLRVWKGLEIYLSFVNIWKKSNFNIQKLKKMMILNISALEKDRTSEGKLKITVNRKLYYVYSYVEVIG